MKFEEALKEMIKHLDSDEFKTQEDTQTTLPAITILQEINKAGFLTTDSQTGEDSRGFNKDTKRYYHVKERAYVDGYMRRERAIKCIEYLNTYTDKIAFFVYENSDPVFEKLYYEGDANAVPSIPVTISGTSVKGYSDITRFSSVTKIPTILPKSNVEFYKKEAKLNKTEDVLWVVIIDPEYGRHALTKNGLFKVVLDALK